jgi:transcriptional regulator with XRE-family HTH domain
MLRMGGLTEAFTGEFRTELARRRMSQADLARSLGHSTNWVSRRLRADGKIKLDEVYEIAAALEMDWQELVLSVAARTAA